MMTMNEDDVLVADSPPLEDIVDTSNEEFYGSDEGNLLADESEQPYKLVPAKADRSTLPFPAITRFSTYFFRRFASAMPCKCGSCTDFP